MRTGLPELWSSPVTVDVRPRRFRRRMLGLAAASTAAAALAAGMWFGALPDHQDVALATEEILLPPFTVEMSAFDGAPPFDVADGPNRDAGPSNGIVRQGDPVTYVIDIGVRAPITDVVIALPVPHGFTAEPVPDYCDDGSGFDEIGLRCHVGDLEAGRYVTRTVTMTAGPRSETDGLPISAAVTANDGAVRIRSGEVTVRVATTAGACDPRGVVVPGTTATPDGEVVADGHISGLVTSGPDEVVTLDGVDHCGHEITRTVTPFEGRFSFTGLLPGTYRLTVDGRAPTDITLQPGTMATNGVTF